MATVLVVVADVQAHEPDEMPLTEDNYMLQHLAAAVSDPALGGTVLPRAAIRNANRLCAHGPYELHHCRAEDRVAVKDEVSWCRVVWERLAQLLNHPRWGCTSR